MRATQNRITGYFATPHYLGAAMRQSQAMPLEAGPGDPKQLQVNVIPDADWIASHAPNMIMPPVNPTPVNDVQPIDLSNPPGAIAAPPIDLVTKPPQYILASMPVRTGRTGTVYYGNGGGSVVPVRQSDTPQITDPDIVPPIYPTDPNVGTTLPTLTPTSSPVPTVTTPPPTTAIVPTVVQPTLTPTSSPVPTVTTPTDNSLVPVATVPGATPLSTTTPTTATAGTVTIFGMKIPTIWLLIGGALLALYFFFGGSKKR